MYSNAGQSSIVALSVLRFRGNQARSDELGTLKGVRKNLVAFGSWVCSLPFLCVALSILVRFRPQPELHLWREVKEIP